MIGGAGVALLVVVCFLSSWQAWRLAKLERRVDRLEWILADAARAEAATK